MTDCMRLFSTSSPGHRGSRQRSDKALLVDEIVPQRKQNLMEPRQALVRLPWEALGSTGRLNCT